MLVKLGRLNETFLMWVPEHSNIAGNENPDRLARRGSGSAMVEPEPALGIHLLAGKKSCVRTWGR